MARVTKRSIEQVHHQPRGWGAEFWIENLPDYCGKILVILKGKRGSLHFHMDKLETMLLVEGRVNLRMIDPADGQEYFVELEKGDSILIPRGQVHQIIGVESSKIIEFSTTHEESDSYRVQKGD